MSDTKSHHQQHPDASTACDGPADRHSGCHASSVFGVILDRTGLPQGECPECHADLMTLEAAAADPAGFDDRLTSLAQLLVSDLRDADFVKELTGTMYTCDVCYGRLRDRLEVVKKLLGDHAFTDATAWLEAEWRQKHADIRFFRECEVCGGWEIDARLDDECPVCLGNYLESLRRNETNASS